MWQTVNYTTYSENARPIDVYNIKAWRCRDCGLISFSLDVASELMKKIDEVVLRDLRRN